MIHKRAMAMSITSRIIWRFPKRIYCTSRRFYYSVNRTQKSRKYKILVNSFGSNLLFKLFFWPGSWNVLWAVKCKDAHLIKEKIFWKIYSLGQYEGRNHRNLKNAKHYFWWNSKSNNTSQWNLCIYCRWNMRDYLRVCFDRKSESKLEIFCMIYRTIYYSNFITLDWIIDITKDKKRNKRNNLGYSS